MKVGTSTNAVSDPAVVNIIAGSTGAGKTTYTLALARRIGGVTFSIDEWMTALFWMDSGEPISHDWALERIARCETVIWNTVRQLAARGLPCILDLGFTKAEHRAKVARLATQAGLSVQLHWLDVPLDERWRRVQRRNAVRGETYAMQVDREMFDFMESIWEPPGVAEMASLNGLRAAGAPDD